MKSLPIDVSRVLASLPLFQLLTAEELARVAEGTRERVVTKGALLFNKGDAATGFFVVVTGQIKLALPSAQGLEKVVDIVGPGQSFGEALVFAERPYPVFAEALLDSRLLHVGAAALLDQIERNARFARRLLAGLAIRLHGLVKDVESYTLRSSTQRVIGYLLDRCAEAPPGAGDAEIKLAASKHVIASRLNLTPETLSRVLHHLADTGLIRVSGRTIAILDMHRLREFD